jgi:hypothetical protein
MTGPALDWAQVGAALPGPLYVQHLFWLHTLLRPATYLEIGVAKGDSLHMAQPPTQAVGVDPNPQIVNPSFIAPTRLFEMTSDAFFAPDHWEQALGRTTIDLAFIDGAHLIEQVLRDFINVERHCTAHAVVAFHDTLPLTEAAADRAPVPGLWCGDVWRILPALERWRPDLRVATLPTGPSGLTIVTRLDPESHVLDANFETVVAEVSALPYGWLEARRPVLLAAHDNSATGLGHVLATR